jgi:serine/threonine protein kinase/Tol biopolymer transport system component
MGDVYRAYDEVLRRRVALKLLRARTEHEGEAAAQASVGRIIREARMAAALDHPNVVAIYDVGESDGAPFIVMEHVSGTPLRAMVGAPGVPIAERVRWLVETARALGAAHRAGLVHRDVKPENVMIRDDGVVKVLDFGIARRARTDSVPPPSQALRDSSLGQRGHETLGANTIGEGRVVGTPAYMAPEQIRSGQLDERVDQFAWGVMAWELLMGTLPWPSPSVNGSLLLDVLSIDVPPLDADALGIPRDLARAIARATQKSPGDRYASMDGLLASIGVGSADSGRRSLAELATPAPAVRVDAETIDAAMLSPQRIAIASGNAAAIPTPHQRTLEAPAHSPTPPTHRTARGRNGAFALGAMLVAAALVGGRSVFRRMRGPDAARAAASNTGAPSTLPSAAASASAARLPGYAFHPRDVRRLTFAQGCEEYPSFGHDGREVVFDAQSMHDVHLYAIDVDSGAQRQLTSGRGWQWAPAVSPDGASIAYLSESAGQQQAWWMPIDGKQPPKLLGNGVVRPSWSPDGRAVWVGAVDTALRIDPTTVTTTRTLRAPAGYEMVAVTELVDGRVVARFGDRQTHLVKGIAIYEAGATADPRWVSHDIIDEAAVMLPDASGMVITKVNRGAQNELTLVPLDGGPERPVIDKTVVATKGMAISPAGDRVVWSTCSARYDVVTPERASDGRISARSIMPMTEWEDTGPAWIAGTRKIVIASDRGGEMALWVLDLDERELPRKIPSGSLSVGSPAVSPDGSLVAFSAPGAGIFVVPFDGSAAPLALSHGGDDAFPTFSRDGKTVYFEARDGKGRPRIEAAPASGGVAKLVRQDAAFPAASRVADELAFVPSAESDSVGVPSIYSLADGKVRPMSPELGAGHYSMLRISPDGRKYAVIRGETEVLEVDAKSGKMLRRYESGPEQLGSIEYAGEQLLVARLVWTGDLWSARDPFVRE